MRRPRRSRRSGRRRRRRRTHDADEQHRHRDERGDQRGMAVRDDLRLRALLEEHAVQRDRRERDDRRERRQDDESEVERPLPVVQIGERGLEGQGEQEAGQDLRARLHHAKLLEHLVPVAVGALGRRLVAAVGQVVLRVGVSRGGHVFILARGARRRQADAAATRPRFQSVLGLTSCAAGWSSSVARWAHNPEVAGSNPVPATKRRRRPCPGPFFFSLRGQDLNLRPLGYEPSELPSCSTPRHKNLA